MKHSDLSKMTGLAGLLVVVALIMAACSPATPTAIVPITGAGATPTVPVGMMLAGTITSGMMPGGLYMYTKDTAGVSNCTGDCLKTWPPLVATVDMLAGAGVPGKLGSIMRADGTKQVTYNDMPLYYWASDTKPGDTTGQGVGGVWFMMSPTAPIK